MYLLLKAKVKESQIELKVSQTYFRKIFIETEPKKKNSSYF